MWRAFFSAVGIVLVIMGLECLVLDHAILVQRTQATDPYQGQIRPISLFGGYSPPAQAERVFRPAEGHPWSLLAGGAVTVLYALSYRAKS